MLNKKILNTFYLRLYGIGHMVKDHADSERGNPLLPLHGILFTIDSKGSFICTISQTENILVTLVCNKTRFVCFGPIELFLVPDSAPRLV